MPSSLPSTTTEMSEMPESSAAAVSSRINMNKRNWGGSAFILESLLLVVFFIASFAIILQLLSISYSKGQQAEELTNAVMLASQEAESFSFDPTASTEPKHFAISDDGDVSADATYDASVVYTVARSVESTQNDAGTLYNAHITVEYGSKEIYSIDTVKYVPSVDPGRRHSTQTGSTTGQTDSVGSAAARSGSSDNASTTSESSASTATIVEGRTL